MSEDVSKFLEQVRELGDRRAEEDEIRSRELEEKILADRKERQARRAERARSISPQKSSPANTPPPSAHRPTTPSQRLELEPSPSFEPPRSPDTPSYSAPPEEMATQNFYSTSASKENESPLDAENKRASNPLSPSRSATVRGLNWQRRPNSQISNGTRSRPLSMVAAENAARSSTTPSEATSATEAVSRDQISQALSSKDPSWFRQTADRGATSGAYRKNQVEDEDRTDTSAMSAQLHGLTRRPSTDPTKDDPDSRPNSGAPHGLLGSPMSLTTSQRLDPPKTEDALETDNVQETQAPASPGRTSPLRSDRPNSPTKGLGGFVQSAMMKRSDSVNKRWSVKSPEGLQRADTIASNRNSYIGPRGSISLGRDHSFEEPARPGSSSSRPGSSKGIKDTAAEKEELPPAKIEDAPEPRTETPQEPAADDEEKTTPPTSPSKTMDPRRWSPTKASWLESALNKPESPKPKAAPAPVNQPPWMAEIAKAKAQKAANGGERSRAPTISHKHQVSIGGLARASAPGTGARPLSIVGSSSGSGAPSPITTQRTGYGSGAPSPIIAQRTGYGSERKGSVDSSATSEVKSEVGKPTERARAATTAASNKPKPEAPPKMDFRASLQSRAPPSRPDSTGPADFKSVIGSLRKTTTQNYQAPDEFKGNILRGKAALNLTGGPKKTERVDEFKEAILAKKKDFSQAQTEGRGITRNPSSASEQPVPEGLVKSLALNRSKSIKRDSISSSTPFGAGLPRKSISSTERPTLDEQKSPVLDRRPSIGFQRNSAREVPSVKPVDKTAPTTSLPKETGVPGRLPGKIGGNVLANRFNPNLAGLLARGPPPMATGSSNDSATGSDSSSTEPASGPKLTHMTKGRARGPKRKAPTSAASTTEPVGTTEPSAPLAAEDSSDVTMAASPAPEATADPIRTPTSAQVETFPSMDSSQKDTQQTRSKPEPLDLAAAHKQPIETTSADSNKAPSPLKTRTRSKSRVFEQVAALAAQRNSPSPTKETHAAGSQPASPRKLDLKRVSRFGSDFSPDKSPERESHRNEKTPTDSDVPKPLSIKPPSPTESKPEVRPSPSSFSGRPLPEPEKTVPQHATETTRPGRLPSPLFGAASGGRELPSPPLHSSTSIKTNPLTMTSPVGPRALPTPGPPSPRPLPSPLRSPSKHAIEVSSVLNDFFGPTRPKRNYQVDSADLLMQRPNITTPKLQTLSAQLFHFSADGKKTPVPAHNDRVLFEQEMYLCSHTFNNESGKKTTEVYFWSGDEVPDAVVQDASIFVAREARALGGALVKLQQNKETPEFLAALGGIVITRRGSSNKYDSLAPHMMCGRRYLGQIVFDEVDFNSAALCSGFPYLVTSSGKCYLWKGKGSGADELSCARLVGMDYALTGELEEIEDGQEPEAFWSIFGGSKRLDSADHWRLKPNYDKYCCRLFRSDASAKQQIIELSPFSQRDLDQTGIFVLDAFFELYIIVGARAQPQYASFHNALEFAQEFAILAAGMEDRPFVPVSTVILEGIPRDMKSVFRKWQDASSPTITNPSGGGTGLRRGRSLRIMPLNTALQALRD